MRKILFATTIALTAIGSGCSKTDSSEASPTADKAGNGEEKVPELTPDEVEKGVASKELTAVDCNHDELRKKLGVVPGALLAPDTNFDAKLLPADKKAKLVFYCSDPG